MSRSFPLLYGENVLILQMQFHINCILLDMFGSVRRYYAPVAQGIEHRPPEAGAAVRIRPGVYFYRMGILYDKT